jgi:hypothetical protein
VLVFLVAVFFCPPVSGQLDRLADCALRQICNWIPKHLVPKLARETKVEDEARTYKPWSHVVALLYAQLTHSLGLNDVCDALALHSGPLSAIRGATPPKRNTPSHANRERDARPAKFYGADKAYLDLLHLFELFKRGEGVECWAGHGTSIRNRRLLGLRTVR